MSGGILAMNLAGLEPVLRDRIRAEAERVIREFDGAPESVREFQAAQRILGAIGDIDAKSDRRHRDEPGCDCGLCEPAEGAGGTVGAVLSGNPACEFPACAYMGDRCRWGDRPCFNQHRYPEGI